MSLFNANRCPAPRFLVRGVNWLGDAVMTAPALSRLREAFPAAHIALLTPEKLADLWQHHLAVDAIHAFGPKESMRQIARQLRGEGFDVGIALPNSTRSALELWLAGIPMRLGYGGRLRRLLLTHPVRRRAEWVPMRKRSQSEIRRLSQTTVASAPPEAWPERAHHLHDYLDLIAPLGANPAPIAPRLYVSDEEIRHVRERFRLPEERDRLPPLVGINAGAEYGGAKRWPPDHFIETAAWVQERLPCRWVILGGLADRSLSRWLAIKLAQAIAPRSPESGGSQESVIHVAGKTSLRELCAVLQTCRAVLTNDTGPMHVAAAVGTPVVVPFGSTSPALTAPGLPRDPRPRLARGPAACAPCFRRECPIDFRCLRNLGPRTVGRLLLNVLTATGQRGG